jgi:pyruvate dehydrogenase E2 component (dihydrolipoamide acetyltransferase)
VSIQAVASQIDRNRITSADVERAAANGIDAAQSGELPPLSVSEERPLSGIRRTIAERLGRSYRDAVHVTLGREVTVDDLLQAAEIADEIYDQDVSLVDVLMLALSETLAT